MRHIRKFNEEQVPRIPTYKRGEIVVWANRGNKEIDYSFVKVLAKNLGYEMVGEIHDGYIIKTKPGEEEKVGAEFVDNYPEFFSGYEREDIKDTYIVDKFEDIILELQDMMDSVGSINEFGKSVLPKKWNQDIDNIIKKLEKIKY